MIRRRPLARMAVRTTVVAGTAAAVASSVASKKAAAAAPPPEVEPAPVVEAAPEPAATPAPNTIEQLTQLAALKRDGVLTDAEFESEKAKLLA